jgi:hypothetical protein
MVKELTRATFTCKDCSTPQQDVSIPVPNAESTRITADHQPSTVTDQSTFNLTNPVSFDAPVQVQCLIFIITFKNNIFFLILLLLIYSLLLFVDGNSECFFFYMYVAQHIFLMLDSTALFMIDVICFH